ncbi:hypothetical protein [Longimicrobium terrae]|uniref:Uncharacterized protein n=1 Tax=Longimicrobium terrae TaxID=1639882 RepID=A0A841GYR7_9BACT|nr:hypothetical protein [Longimicrobium terrae]MBB4636600.1 hypothetical protein [Longimicrobium terrae]MBB6070876.1 hypothetical protein [Longimicrobium terrae]NNC28900.1 hypothetical protein [Longimicrobium terrae]
MSRIVAAVRASWATIWLFVIPKELWGLLCVWPTISLAVASHVWLPSGPGKRLIVLAGLWDLVMGFWLMVSAMKVQRDALAAILVNLRDCTYTPIGWDRILREGDAARIDERSLMSFMNRLGLPYEHKKGVRFFRVGIGRSGGMPGGLGVFNIPFVGAVVLVRDDPKEAGVEDRFCLYHELGHTLGDQFAVQSGLRKGVKLPFVTLVLAAAAVHPTPASLLVLGLCFVALLLVRGVLARRRRTLRAVYEMRADRFAIEFLDQAENQYLRENAESVLPRDEDLSPLEHLARVGAARAYIETGVPLPETDQVRSQLAFFLETQLPALNLGAWMILLAGFIGAPGAGLVRGFQWLIGITVVLAVLRFAIHYWKGILIEMILIQRVTWQDGRFRLRRGASRSPAPLT